MNAEPVQQHQLLSHPYINGSTIPNYIGKDVTLIGNCASDVNGDTFAVLASDSSMITVYSNNIFNATMDELVMVRGQVESVGDGSFAIRANYIHRIPSSQVFDRNVFNEFINLAETSFRHLFYE
ncbi:hypothetical protein FDP41_011383 [Naegleria fowleri]|uniref:Replication factor A protein 3 n=1 Tax=Naegleria fowleri TaxID=5763 RepID=A0A6A5BWI5_NAEFO|nr:uncharacterized protein FDP41_011383 [Naegleria fowleri]KAF0982453.1 hypothetical protein FDP41_011383 [Naegleria fowleri]CAG4718273.1 unnamed protein product [Naegleria fowleri]